MTTIPSAHWRLWTGTALSIHFLLILTLGLSHHWGHMSSLNDLGMFDQAVWGTLHGEFLLNTSNSFNTPINWLGVQFSPVLLLFVPLYAISPNAEWLVLAQACALSVTAWPIFLLANRACHSEKAGFLWAFIYLANPFLLNAAAWDFHPIMLAVPFIAFGMLAIEKADSRLLFLSCLPLLFIREHLGLAVAGFGLLWWLRVGSWKPAAGLIAIGIAYSALVLSVVMPALSPTHEHVMLSVGPVDRYGWIGHSASEVVLTILHRPLFVIEKAMIEMQGAAYWAFLLLPFLGFPLAAATWLLPGLADMAANTLSANPMPRSPFAYHSVGLIPVLTVAAIHGAARISRWQKKFSITEITGLALGASMVMGYRFAPAPLPGAFDIWMPTHFVNWPDPSVKTIRATVGNNASASVQANIGAHFSQRRGVYLYPNMVGEVDAIILRLESPTQRFLPPIPQAVATFAHHLQMTPADYVASVHCLLASKTYGVLIWEDPWLVLAKGAPKGEAEREIETRLMRLREQSAQGLKEETRVQAECRADTTL